VVSERDEGAARPRELGQACVRQRADVPVEMEDRGGARLRGHLLAHE
jgi:hypothetical protein